jgi:DNA/RNA endonuclease YhcR with UshA esterase domain
MRNILTIIITFLCFNAFSQEAITASQAKDFVGKEVILTGKVAGARLFKNSSGDLLLLNIDKPFPANEITIAIQSEILAKTKLTEVDVLNKIIKVKGVVSIYKDKPEIKLQNEADLTIL